MKNITIILIVIIFVSCEKSEAEKYKELILINTPKSIFQIIDLKTGETELDTIEMNWNGKRLITKALNDFNEGEKMILANISTYSFDKEIVEESFLNYDLIGDSIRHIDTSFYEIGETKTYSINNESFEIIKEPRSFFNKSNNPNRYIFISKDFGLIGIISKTNKRLLNGYVGKEFSSNEKKIIELLNNDKLFFNLKKEN